MYLEQQEPLEDEEPVPKKGPGRPTRPQFNLDIRHPLAEDYVAVLRQKTKTAMFGGRAVPVYPGAFPFDGDEKDQIEWKEQMNILAKFLLCTFVPWGENGPVGDLDYNHLAQVLRDWDNSRATFTNRARARYMRNIINKTHRHSLNEITTTLWRARNTHWWKDLDKNALPSAMVEKSDRSPEANAARKLEKKMKDSLVLRSLSSKVLLPNHGKREHLQVMTSKFNTLMRTAPEDGEARRQTRNKSVIFPQTQDSEPRAIPRLCTNLKSYKKPDAPPPLTENGINGEPENSRQLGEQAFVEFTDRGTSTDAQWKIIDHIVNTVNDNTGKAEQTCTFLNAGAGVGKSFIGRKCNMAFAARGQTVINMCPTGAGACQMTDGHTFHSIMKPQLGKDLGQGKLLELRDKLPFNLGLVIIDEASMLAAEFLIILDKRLRQMFDRTKVFGGISVLLLGDLVSNSPTCVALFADITCKLLLNYLQANNHVSMYLLCFPSSVCPASVASCFWDGPLRRHVRSKPCQIH